MYKTGETPGKGVYVCKNCGQRIVLDEQDNTLPPCPRCSCTTFSKK